MSLAPDRTASDKMPLIKRTVGAWSTSWSMSRPKSISASCSPAGNATSSTMAASSSPSPRRRPHHGDAPADLRLGGDDHLDRTRAGVDAHVVESDDVVGSAAATTRPCSVRSMTTSRLRSATWRDRSRPISVSTATFSRLIMASPSNSASAPASCISLRKPCSTTTWPSRRRLAPVPSCWTASASCSCSSVSRPCVTSSSPRRRRSLPDRTGRSVTTRGAGGGMKMKWSVGVQRFGVNRWCRTGGFGDVRPAQVSAWLRAAGWCGAWPRWPPRWPERARRPLLLWVARRKAVVRRRAPRGVAPRTRSLPAAYAGDRDRRPCVWPWPVESSGGRTPGHLTTERVNRDVCSNCRTAMGLTLESPSFTQNFVGGAQENIGRSRACLSSRGAALRTR